MPPSDSEPVPETAAEVAPESAPVPDPRPIAAEPSDSGCESGDEPVNAMGRKTKKRRVLGSPDTSEPSEPSEPSEASDDQTEDMDVDAVAAVAPVADEEEEDVDDEEGEGDDEDEAEELVLEDDLDEPEEIVLDGAAAARARADGRAQVAREAADALRAQQTADREALHRAHQGALMRNLENVKGWKAEIMRESRGSVPVAFTPQKTWAPLVEKERDPEGMESSQLMRPNRVEVMFVPAGFFADGAQTIGEWETPADESALARACWTAALLGLQTTGYSKGHTNSSEHVHLQLAKAAATEEASQKKADEDRDKPRPGMSYQYFPHRKDVDNQNRLLHKAAQFRWVVEEVYDVNEHMAGLRIYKLIFDADASSDEHWAKLIAENLEGKKHSQVDGVPEARRKKQAEQQGHRDSLATNEELLHVTARNQYKKVTNTHDVLKMYRAYAGTSHHEREWPLFADIGREVQPGFADDPIVRDNEMGGRHPLGPSAALNHLRYEVRDDAAGEPGINVSMAGMYDAKGVPIDVHAAQRVPTAYYDAEGYFWPPEFVRDKGCMWVLTDTSQLNLFDVPLPRAIHGSAVPDDLLLQIYWELERDKNKALRAAWDAGKRTLAENRRLLLDQFESLRTKIDAGEAEVLRCFRESKTNPGNSTQATLRELQNVEVRSYGDTDDNGVACVGMREILRDLNKASIRVFQLIERYHDAQRQQIEQLARTDLVSAQVAEGKRQMEHGRAIDAAIRLTLAHWDNAYNSRRFKSMIPPGWRAIRQGTAKAMVEAGEIAAQLHELRRGYAINPKDSNRARGTANLGHAFDQNLHSSDVSVYGQLRAWQMDLFTRGLKVGGSDAKIMYEIHLHSFEVTLPRCFYLLFCGTAGSGKSERVARMAALYCDGWYQTTGAGSEKADTHDNGFADNCGRVNFADEIPKDFGAGKNARQNFIKNIATERCVSTKRLKKQTNANGEVEFVTKTVTSMHYETFIYTANTGPLGISTDVEPGTERVALVDRTIAHVVYNPLDSDDALPSGEFDIHNQSLEMRMKICMHRVRTGLMFDVLNVIKDNPHLKPEFHYARRKFAEWDAMQTGEYGLQEVSPRKKEKREMTALVMAVESAVHEKFFVRETGDDYADMRFDAEGYVRAFDIGQLADVIRSLPRCLNSDEVLNLAWSHALDYSPATAAHTHHTALTLAQVHGHHIERLRFHGPPQLPPGGGAPEPANGGTATAAATAAAAGHAPQFADADGAVGAVGPYGTNPQDPLVSSTDIHGKPNMHVHYPRGVMHPGVTRAELDKNLDEISMERQVKQQQKRLLYKKKQTMPLELRDVTKERAKLLANGYDADGTPTCTLTATQQTLPATEAAALLHADLSAMMAAGFPLLALQDWSMCSETQSHGDKSHYTGLNVAHWRYATKNHKDVRGPCDWDFNWKVLSAFPEFGADDPAGKNDQRNLFSYYARVLLNLIASLNSRVFSMFSQIDFTHECLRDTMFMMGLQTEWNKILLPTQDEGIDCAHDKLKMHHNQREFGVMNLPPSVHPQRIWVKDPTTHRSELHPEFAKASRIGRPSGWTTEQNDATSRLDFLNNRSALAPLLQPAGFAKAVPVKKDPNSAGLLVSTYFMSECARLSLEMALDLSRRPGIRDGEYTDGPSSFNAYRHPAAAATALTQQELAQVSAEAAAKAAEQTNRATARAVAAADAAAGISVSTYAGVSVVEDTFRAPVAGPDLEQEAEERASEEDEQEAGVAAGTAQAATAAEAPPPLQESRAMDVELRPVQEAVRNPGGPGTGIAAEPGAAHRSMVQSLSDDAPVENLPFFYDMLSMYLSFKTAETCCNDCEPYVDEMRAAYPDVFGNESKEETMMNLPHMTQRAPAPDGIAVGVMMPLTCQVPLTESRVSEFASASKSRKKISPELQAAASSASCNRSIEANDERAQKQKADASGLPEGLIMRGNVHKRSTGRTFTHSACVKKGFFVPEPDGSFSRERDRIQDHDVGMRWRVLHHRMVKASEEAYAKDRQEAEEEANDALGLLAMEGEGSDAPIYKPKPVREPNTLATPKTFHAQYRRKRAREMAGGSNDDGGDAQGAQPGESTIREAVQLAAYAAMTQRSAL